ncbi:MAG: aminoacetone oxidase family FAD-binding enzyme, partial [Gammaproteobacteria bacterium]|nr:aminoacetone oxidase family FAD-binding enzyme [Gammaproteobacteria bacterium]
MKQYDAIIIGASASGLMCAIEAGKRHRKVLVLDHANKPGKKILMSGGGKCNFTNYDVSAENYISHNPHFCKSALKQFTQWDFIAKVTEHNIPYHERDHGQLFCDNSAKDILNMLLDECQSAEIQLNTNITRVTKTAEAGFQIKTDIGDYQSESLVIASGGLSIPKMCASPFGYRIAEQFGLKVWPTSAGLVPFTLQPADKGRFAPLSGIAIDSIVSFGKISFRENILFTHRGLSGPAILQISSYWQAGESITINLLPDVNIDEELQTAKKSGNPQKVKTVLHQYLPRRVLETLLDEVLLELPIQNLSNEKIKHIEQRLHHWLIKPNGTEGYRT